MKKALFYLLQWTWALSQNIVGGIGCLLLAMSGRHRRENYHGAVVTYVDTDNANFGGISLGMFIFFNANAGEQWQHDTRIHEFGHCVQSIVLGPLYWLVVALPSIIWCNAPPFAKLHNKKETKYLYYKLYCETWANVWGTVWTGGQFVSDDMLKGGWFGTPWVEK